MYVIPEWKLWQNIIFLDNLDFTPPNGPPIILI